MKSRILAVILVLLGGVMFLHHFYLTGRFFDPADILNHEFFEAIFFSAGLVLFISSYYRGK